MQLKSRQIVLFFIACFTLWFADFAGASLLAMASLLQLSILLRQMPFTQQSQWGVFKIFLLTLPLLFFWGGAHSFVFIYLNEKSFLMALMATTISFCLCFLIGFQLIFSVEFLEKNNFAAIASLQNAFNEIKNKKNQLLKTAGYIFIFSLVPWLSEDWKLVFSLTATLFYLYQPQLKMALSRS